MGAGHHHPPSVCSTVNRSFRRFLVALLLAVAVYGGFVLWTGYHSLAKALDSFAWWTFFAALGLSSFNYVLRFMKWEYYLKRLDIRGVPKWDSFLIFLSGFVLTITPGKVGEVFKSAVLQSTHRVDLAKTAPIIVAERLTDVVAIVVLVVAGSLGFQGGLPWALAGTAAVLVGLAMISWPPPLQYVIEQLQRRSGRAQAWVPKLKTAQQSLLLVAHPRALLVPTLLSLIGWGGEGFALNLLLQGFGEPTPLTLSLFFYATATLAGALIPVPGGLGVAEGIMQSQLVQLGRVAQGAATGSMLMIRFATLWWAVLVGFVALALLKLRYPQLMRADASAPASL